MQNNRTILKVSELNAEVGLLLKQGFPLLWIEGEISNFSRPASGHMYFSLKDNKAQIRCAMFRNKNIHLDLKPENGMKILLRGRIGLYEPRGEFQLIADHIEEAGSGLLQQQFEALKAKLAEKGWFDNDLKKPLAKFPRQIGIISSPTGAALRDILNVLKRRCPQIPVLIYPTTVQGDKAALQLESAVRQANIRKDCDVLLLTRGGGSIEDLAAFNDENLARALYESDIPIITGIGHEIDFTIADFIADMRAPTPSAAAELVAPDNQQLTSTVKQLQQQLYKSITQTLKQKTESSQWLAKRLEQKQPSYLLQQQSQRLDELDNRLQQRIRHLLDKKHASIQSLKKQLNARSPKYTLKNKQQKLKQQTTLLQKAIQKNITTKKSNLALQLAKLDAISPLKTLERGYAIVRDENKTQVIKSVAQINTGETINIKITDGNIISKVISLNAQ
ncbi:MAG: exodeoxyribonuclease VII large subunit [Aquificaceae bacterium]|nr:MAG: exodeoxyribonuclease VII large subunit [Aquificaceae bacterium]